MSAFGALTTGPLLSICCGPRCGAEPGHRLVYDALEKCMATACPDVTVRPTMCQGLCGGGVTVVTRPAPDAPAIKEKIRDVAHARAFVYSPFPKDTEKEPCPR